MVDSRNSANIKFNDITISSSNLLGEENNGAAILEEVLDRAQIAISAEMLGNASQAFDVTCLLYTSPSPRDVEESRMPSSA